VPDVLADEGRAGGEALAQDFRVDPLGGGGLFHLVGDDALAGEFKLGHVFRLC
jgi:hypothetical protein